MIKPLIEFCISNLASGGQAAREQLEKDPNLDIIEYGCLGYCGKCADSFFVLVNGDFVGADSPGDLVKNVNKYLDENPMF